MIDVEVDMNNKTIYFFLSSKQFHSYVNNIPSSCLLFGISANYSTSIVEVISVRKLKKSSADPSVICEPQKWR
jgi:hypothetical protein